MQNGPIRTVAVIGAGVLGRELALRAALAGFEVVLEDVLPGNLRNARAQIDPLLHEDAKIHYVSTVEDAVRTADLAIDFVPDELESKLEIFCLMDRMAPPKTIFCTLAVQVSVADIAACTYRAPRCMAVHPAVAGEKLYGTTVQLLRTASTPEDVADAVCDFWRALKCQVVLEVIAAA